MNAAQRRQVDILELFAEGQRWARIELDKREANLVAYVHRAKALDNAEQLARRKASGKEARRRARKKAARLALSHVRKLEKAAARAAAESLLPEAVRRRRQGQREWAANKRAELSRLAKV